MRNPALVSNQSMTARTWSPRRRRYLPRKATIFCFSTTAVFAIAIAAIAFAVDVPNVSSITAAVAFVLFTIIFAVLDRSYRRGKKRVDRDEFVRIGRWISATLRRSVLWLGFVVPRPNSSRSVAFRIVVWVLVERSSAFSFISSSPTASTPMHGGRSHLRMKLRRMKLGERASFAAAFTRH